MEKRKYSLNRTDEKISTASSLAIFLDEESTQAQDIRNHQGRMDEFGFTCLEPNETKSREVVYYYGAKNGVELSRLYSKLDVTLHNGHTGVKQDEWVRMFRIATNIVKSHDGQSLAANLSKAIQYKCNNLEWPDTLRCDKKTYKISCTCDDWENSPVMETWNGGGERACEHVLVAMLTEVLPAQLFTASDMTIVGFGAR